MQPWRTLCRCRHCRFKMYDTLSSLEYEGKVFTNEFLGPILNRLCDVELDGAFFKEIGHVTTEVN